MVRRALVRAVLAPQVVEQRQAGRLAAGLGVGAWQKKRPYGEESSSETHRRVGGRPSFAERSGEHIQRAGVTTTRELRGGPVNSRLHELTRLHEPSYVCMYSYNV